MRVVSEGVFLQLRPLLDRQGKVKLEVSLRSSKIREVKTLTVAGPSGKGVTVQVPEVETACVDTAVELASNHWLLVRCMEQQGPDGKPDSTVETGWKKRLLPSGLQRKGADRKPVSTLVMLWAGKPQDSHSGPFPWRRDK
jgi:hypothetical protein